MPYGCTAFRFDPHPAACRSARELRQYGVRADEIAGSRAFEPADLLDRPFETGFDRIDALVYVRTVKAQTGFQAERIPRAESNQFNTVSLKQRLSDLHRFGTRNANLKSILPRIS